MMAKVYLAPAADSDREAVLKTIANDRGVDHACAYVEGLRKKIERILGTFPEAGRLRPELGHGVRTYPYDTYVVVYRLARGQVRIVRILHGHRDLGAQLISLLLHPPARLSA